jgi:SAM-dependent methyltransferase
VARDQARHPPTDVAACPRCLSPLADPPADDAGRRPGGSSIGSGTESCGRCGRCGLVFTRTGELLDVLHHQQREVRAAAVERFYTASPFPGYAPDDDAGSLLDRSRRSAFLTGLDAAVNPRGRVLDLGCGTAQRAAFLALAGPQRQVLGVDGCRESLLLAEAFRARAAIDNLQLLRADLFGLPLGDHQFDTVICRGVVHHTPDPEAAIERVASCVAPDGVLVLGFYESWGRLFHRFRRGISLLLGGPLRCLDPILRRRDLDAEKRRIWIDDQYRHPLEHILALPRVLRVLDDLGFQWVRTIPPTPRQGATFEPTYHPGWAGLTARRAAWLLRGVTDPDAGLVCYVAQRRRDR